MKTKFLMAAAALTFLTTPAFASTPTSDPFTRSPSDRATQLTPDQYTGYGNTSAAPFGDHLRQNRMDDMRSLNGRSQNKQMPPRMDASGVPDPRI